VVGSEAGESKLSKARNFGTPQLTEEQFIDLIRQKSVKETENKTPKTSPEKLEKNQK
jgi:BRCT domain type II-containing protein